MKHKPWNSQFAQYENLPMQYTDIYSAVKTKMRTNDTLNICAQNIDRGYTLEPSRRSGSDEYPQSMLWIKDNKKM